MSKNYQTTLLCILDGWGYSENSKCNAILQANTPNWDQLWSTRPKTLITTHGVHVGLAAGQMGNSEVGHINIGAGRVVYQEATRINRSILTKSFFKNEVLVEPVKNAAKNDKAIHIMGLVSTGGVHSYLSHIEAMIKLAAQHGVSKIFCHAFLDGRDTPPQSAKQYLQQLEDLFAQLGVGKVASIIGRFYAMDRDHRWQRVEKAYNMIINGEAEYHFNNSISALEAAYSRAETDEFVNASIIGEPVPVEDGDSIIFMNFRSDRARELTESILFSEFSGFNRTRVPKIHTFVSLTKYKDNYPTKVAFPTDYINNCFGEYIANLGLLQLRIAETEKYPHVTFFFNGGVERKFAGEDRILINSPKVKTYDLQPEMSAYPVTDELVKAINSSKYDVIICNFANSDMVGHTGMIDAAVQAIEVLDECIGKVVTAIEDNNGQMLITADHGNSEQMCDYDTGETMTAHTTNLVPLVYIGDRANVSFNEHGCLSDLAPTLLDLMDIDKPSEMGGCSLIAKD